MANDRVCVGGIDLDNKRSVRLLTSTGVHETLAECPYNIWDIWDVTYRISNRRPKPHTEDVNVISRARLDSLGALNRRIDKFSSILEDCAIPFFRGPLTESFDGKLKITDNGSLFISEENVSDYSTCFWICDRNLLGYESRGKMKFRYNDNSTMYGYTVSYVGLSDISKTIPAGSLVRLSLAHWWSPDDSDDEERCYLQLSGCLIESMSAPYQQKGISTNIDLSVKEALRGYRCHLKESVYCYDNSDTHILHLVLSKLFQGQDYLVISQKAAEAILNCDTNEEQKKLLAECRVSYCSEIRCYKITLPPKTKTIAEFVFDEEIDNNNKIKEMTWHQTELRNFTKEEIDAVSYAEIVLSQYGKSICFHMKEGGQCYIPLDKGSDWGVGEIIDISNAKLMTLSKDGENNILRVVL